jgi:ferrous iron transport protein A
MNVTDDKLLRLSHLPIGEKGIIQFHEPSDFQLMLMEMGCVPGEAVCVEMIAPLGDPMAIRVAGYYLSIRKEDAEKIMVSLQSCCSSK